MEMKNDDMMMMSEKWRWRWLMVLRVGHIVIRKKREERPPTLMLLRKRLLRSQSVARAEVQAGAFKELAGLAPTQKKPAQQTRKKNACV